MRASTGAMVAVSAAKVTAHITASAAGARSLCPLSNCLQRQQQQQQKQLRQQQQGVSLANLHLQRGTNAHTHAHTALVRTRLSPSRAHPCAAHVAIAMAVVADGDAAAAATTVVEHLVFFKVKADASDDKIAAMVLGLSDLESLPGVLLLRVGAAVPGVPSDGRWTHALYGRYESKDALAAYSAHPAHVAAVTDLVKPIAEEVLAVDWEADRPAAFARDDGARVVHAVVLEWKGEEGGEGRGVSKEVGAAVAALRAHEGSIPGLRQLTMGPNFSPGRNQGFTWGFLATFADVDALKAYAAHPEHRAAMVEKVFPIVKRFTGIDFEAGVKPSAGKL